MFFFVIYVLFLFIAALWSPAGKGLTSSLACILSSLMFGHFPMWCPGSGVVLDCINSRSLPSYLIFIMAISAGPNEMPLLCQLIRIYTVANLPFVGIYTQIAQEFQT